MKLVNKYIRTIRHHAKPEYLIEVDVYSVLEAFDVKNPGLQHAVKKLLCSGIRGNKDTIQDLKEAIQAIERAIIIEEGNANEKAGTRLRSETSHLLAT